MAESVSSDHGSNPVRQFVIVILAMVFMYLCMQTLRFTNNGLNVAFLCLFLLLPLLLAPAALRLRRRAKVVAAVFLLPVLAVSLLSLFFVAIFDIPAAVRHRQLSRELSTLHQRRYSVHLAWEETAGGALGPHGLSLEQRMTILPGLYAVKPLDYFEGARDGSLSAAGTDRIALHVAATALHREVDQVYSLKPWLYF
jgi:hypothetical protein